MHHHSGAAVLLMSLLLAVFLKQFFGGKNPLHQDDWLTHYYMLLYKTPLKALANPTALFGLGISLSSVALIALTTFLNAHSPLLLGLFAAAVLLYSFGRGELNAHITQFIVAEAKNDWDEALKAAQKLGIKSFSEADSNQKNWLKLNESVLSKVSYLGFERLFAVIFWFVILGPVGAFIYRFTQLWLERWSSDAVARFLWFMEWPAVRIMGLSLAITGNFASCFIAWKRCLFCALRSSEQFLLENVMASLAVDEQLLPTQDVTRRELNAIQQLLSRTLWLWLGVIAIFYIIG